MSLKSIIKHLPGKHSQQTHASKGDMSQYKILTYGKTRRYPNYFVGITSNKSNWGTQQIDTLTEAREVAKLNYREFVESGEAKPGENFRIDVWGGIKNYEFNNYEPDTSTDPILSVVPEMDHQ